MIAVAVNAWRRNEQSESFEELEGRERESGAATRCRMGETIDEAFAAYAMRLSPPEPDGHSR